MTRLSQKVHGPMIAEMVERGMTSREIATALGSTEAAVKGVRRRLGLTSPGRPVDLSAVERLTRSGLSAREIAAHLGVHERTVQRARVKLGISQSPPDPYPADVRERALRMATEGVPKSEVARTLGVAPNTVDSWTRHIRGISLQEIAIFSSALRALNEMGRPA